MVLPTLRGTPECSASGAPAPATYDGASPIAVDLNHTQVGSPARPLFASGGVVARSIWNEALLHDDQTWGVHNLPFVLDVLASTQARLETLP